MNKIKLIIVVFFFIIIFCIVGTFFVQADTEIKEEQDILTYQNEITNNINIYGYTIDNPNIIVNPYNENYNSALIIFQTDEYTSIKVNVNDIYIFNTNKTNKHYIGLYNLITGKNYITLSYEGKTKKIEIDIKEEGNFIDLENATVLSNNHLLVPTDKYLENNNYTGLREIDALGKIYYEYLLEDGYEGISCEIDEEKLAVLSNNLIILDRQNGNIIDIIDISDYKTNWLGMKYDNSNIIIYGDDIAISVNLKGNITEIEEIYEKEYFSGDINYQNKEGIRFYKKIITETSNKNIWLIKYEKQENNEIEIKKEYNRLIVTSKRTNKCDTYLILEKAFDKKVYELCNNTNYIYTYDFKGKYSIYLKKDGTLYKTNKYVKF